VECYHISGSGGTVPQILLGAAAAVLGASRHCNSTYHSRSCFTTTLLVATYPVRDIMPYLVWITLAVRAKSKKCSSHSTETLTKPMGGQTKASSQRHVAHHTENTPTTHFSLITAINGGRELPRTLA